MKKAGLEVDHESNTESEDRANRADSSKGLVVPLKVAYVIYVLPVVLLVGILFLLNARYGITTSSTLLCITFPLILSILLISLFSIIQYWRKARN
jgi:hypothetical protein